MADEQKRNGEGGKRDDLFGSDSGLGNLPPLSDFDSSSGLSSDSGLPPLSNFEGGTPSQGGLPPLGDISIETPRPTGGNVKPGAAEFDTNTELFSSGSSAFKSSGTGFQDLAADSDFSPETPEIGPGPESDVDTPMFDSAFGGSGFDAAVQTPAPTQAMETPMFGAGPSAGPTFDRDAFGGSPFGGGGTPMPDFSPDTAIGGAAIGAAMGPGSTAVPPEPAGRRGALAGFLVGAVLFLIGGIVAGPYVLPSIPMLPDMLPATAKDTEITQLKGTVAKQNSELDTYRKLPKPGDPTQVSPQELDRLKADIAAKTEELNSVNVKLAEATTAYDKKATDLRQVEDDISRLNAQFLQTQDEYESLQNETTIIQARQKGLLAEVDRLTGLVGSLEEATARSMATKEALAYAVDRLYIQVKEGIPLTPERYARESRIASVEQLREQLQQAPYVTPELQNLYTDLYLQELQIASSQEYFFARITVTDRYGARYSKWAECLSKGNWAVYYRTLDGKNIGSYEDTVAGDAVQWGYREDLAPAVVKQIEEQIIASRVPDYLEKVQLLADKQLAMENATPLQKAFDSL